jgi:hypothetical protein
MLHYMLILQTLLTPIKEALLPFYDTFVVLVIIMAVIAIRKQK